MVSKGPREFGGVAFLLAVHVLIPLHPLRMTLGIVRDGRRRVARRLLRQQIGAEEPGVDDGGGDAERLNLGLKRLHPALQAERRGAVCGIELKAGKAGA
jgi:hypothetical protein